MTIFQVWPHLNLQTVGQLCYAFICLCFMRTANLEGWPCRSLLRTIQSQKFKSESFWYNQNCSKLKIKYPDHYLLHWIRPHNWERRYDDSIPERRMSFGRYSECPSCSSFWRKSIVVRGLVEWIELLPNQTLLFEVGWNHSPGPGVLLALALSSLRRCNAIRTPAR